MIMNDAGVMGVSVLIFLAIGLIFAIGVGAGVVKGRIEVASGEWVCELVENSNKTTSWECEEEK